MIAILQRVWGITRVDNFLTTTGTSGNSCIKKLRQDTNTGKSVTKNTGICQKDSSKAEQTKRLLGMFSFVG